MIPRVSLAELDELQRDFAAARDLGVPFDRSQLQNELLITAASYRLDGNFVRVWYVSDRVNIALVTYVSEWRFRHEELNACELIVKALASKAASNLG